MAVTHQTRIARKTVLLLALIGLAAAVVTARAEPPRLWDPGYRTTTLDLSGLQRLRFLTSLDFPPFNFVDANRRPTGFNVDLARAICAELAVADRCEIQAMPWEELEPALEAARGEVILAGNAPSAALRARFGLSEPYFKFPARFAARRDWSPANASDFFASLADQRVAVVRNTAHETMLSTLFPQVEAVPVEDMPAAYATLLGEEADLIFGDGVTLSFWLASQASNECCTFAGGPYVSDKFLGHGMVAVTRIEDSLLLEAINGALKAAEDSGVVAEIYTRYFPISPYGSGNAASR